MVSSAFPILDDYLKAARPFLFEKEMNQDYDYGCIMASVGFSNSYWNKTLKNIDRNDLYNNHSNEYGLEVFPHVTILYGLHSTIDDSEIEKVIYEIKKPIEMEIVGISCFTQEKYDVLKFDVQSHDLANLNETFKKFPYTNAFPNYIPHITIAYLQPGKGSKYEDDISTFGKFPFSLSSSKIIYSKADGKKIKFKI